MRKQKAKAEDKKMDQSELIKVQIDDKTVVMVRNMSAYEQWHERYPNAKIIQDKHKK
jgi:hypothetical protein